MSDLVELMRYAADGNYNSVSELCDLLGKGAREIESLRSRVHATAPGFVLPVQAAPFPMGAAVIGTACQYMCTKHGLIQFADCDQCAAEKDAPI